MRESSSWDRPRSYRRPATSSASHAWLRGALSFELTRAFYTVSCRDVGGIIQGNTEPSHRFRGLAKVTTHGLLSVDVIQATALAHLAASDFTTMRWSLQRVA